MSFRPAALLLLVLAGPSPAQQAASDRPLPDLETLMAAVQQHQKNDEAIQRNYIYRSATTVEILSKDGAPKRALSDISEVYWIDGVEVQKRIEHNGKALSAEEQKKQEERLNKRTEERRKKQSKEAEKPDEKIPLSRLLELGTFTAPRRENVNGRPTIAVDFTGDPNAKTHNDNEKVIHEVAGTVWIDETDHTVQHIEGRFLRDFKVGGGLIADVGKDTTFRFTKVRVNDELWLPESQEISGHFRLLLLFAANTHLSVQNSDFRKFRASSKVLPGVTEVLADPESKQPESKQSEPRQPEP